MNQNIETIRNSIQTLATSLEQITASAASANRPLTASEQIAAEGIQGAIESQQAIVREAKAVDIVRGQEASEAKRDGRSTVPAVARVTSSTLFPDNQTAYDCGKWIQATLGGNPQALQHCRDRGIIRGAMTTGGNAHHIVPEPLENTVIELREQFGVFRREAQVMPMSDGVTVVPRLSGEVSSYFVAENSLITSSDMSLSSIKLDAKKLAVLTVVSSELNDDAVVSVAELLAKSIAQAFAIQEDACGFNGDGTSQFGGIVGLKTALLAGSVSTSGAGRNTFATLTSADFQAAVGLAKRWSGYQPKWFLSQQGWSNSVQRLLDAAGGNNNRDLATGSPLMFMGYEVVISQSLEQGLSGTSGNVYGYFGDLKAGAYLGSRRGINVQVDSSRYLEYDALAIRGTERFDIRIHDVGSASAAGGLIALKFV